MGDVIHVVEEPFYLALEGGGVGGAPVVQHGGDDGLVVGMDQIVKGMEDKLHPVGVLQQDGVGGDDGNVVVVQVVGD